MKIVSVTPLMDGMSEAAAEELWNGIEKHAGYSFNKSHATAYAIISYICMWLKVHYPAEFFAGYLSHVKDENRAAALGDMTAKGITLLPPDINESTGEFVALNASEVLAPLNSVKAVTSSTVAAIQRAKTVQTMAQKLTDFEDAGGPFTSIEDLKFRVERRMCNSRAIGNLDLVGAFARIEPGQQPPDHHSRRRDQMELMQGLITDTVVIEAAMRVNNPDLEKLSEVINDWKSCSACELQNQCQTTPGIHRDNRFFIVLDNPNPKEAKKGQMGHGSGADLINDALLAHGLSLNDAYVTSLYKAPKPDKGFRGATLTECPAWLDKEIEIMKPPLIVVCGSATARHFLPVFKGSVNEQAGRVHYDKIRNLNILIAVNPGAIYYKPELATLMTESFSKIENLLPAI